MNYLTIFFHEGTYECINIKQVMNFHKLRHDDPFDYEQFIEQDLEIDTYIGYLVSMYSFEDTINNMNPN